MHGPYCWHLQTLPLFNEAKAKKLWPSHLAVQGIYGLRQRRKLRIHALTILKPFSPLVATLLPYLSL
jgi:hypothetical protein